MRFQIDVMDTDVIELVNRFVEITGTEPWSRKFMVLRHQRNENPFLADWQVEHHGIELKFRQLIEEQERTGVFPVQITDYIHYQLYGFIAGIVRIYEQLSPSGQKRLRGMMLDGLKPDNNLLSVQHEILTVVHLVDRGFDVEMNDLENGSGVDFIARVDGLEFEVECKMFTGDLGRKIHRRKVLALHKHLSEMLTRAYGSARSGLLVRITIPDRLNCSPDQLRGIDATVSAALEQGHSVTNSEHCEVGVVDFEIAESPFNVVGPNDVTKGALADFVLTKLGRMNKELMILFSPGKRGLVALVESAKPDEVLKGAYRQLREAAKGQFTKTRPGILSVQFRDLTAEQMESIARSNTTERLKATGLQIMTSDFLASENRKHIHTVAYRSHGRLMSQKESGPNSIRERGLAYYIRNPSNLYFDDPRSRAFG